MGCTDLHDLQSAHRRWVEASLRPDKPERERHWTVSIAVGSKSFIEEVKRALASKPEGGPSQAATIIISLEKLSRLLATLLCRDLTIVKDQIVMQTTPLPGAIFLKRLIFILNWAV